MVVMMMVIRHQDGARCVGGRRNFIYSHRGRSPASFKCQSCPYETRILSFHTNKVY
jgi:hypothetical protein